MNAELQGLPTRRPGDDLYVRLEDVQLWDSALLTPEQLHQRARTIDELWDAKRLNQSNQGLENLMRGRL